MYIAHTDFSLFIFRYLGMIYYMYIKYHNINRISIMQTSYLNNTERSKKWLLVLI